MPIKRYAYTGYRYFNYAFTSVLPKVDKSKSHN